MKPRALTRAAGFTLVELMVTLTLLGIMAALAMPSMAAWMRNNQVRAASDALQTGLRLAQAEALRRSRQTVFSLTDNASPTGVTAKEDGKYWAINTVKINDDDNAAFVEGGVLGPADSDVAIKGPASICFSSIGRLTLNPNPGPDGADCAATSAAYEVTMPGADRNLNVVVAVGGQVRMCDPHKTKSASNPDGC